MEPGGVAFRTPVSGPDTHPTPLQSGPGLLLLPWYLLVFTYTIVT
jgi:hypothetical protein